MIVSTDMIEKYDRDDDDEGTAQHWLNAKCKNTEEKLETEFHFKLDFRSTMLIQQGIQGTGQSGNLKFIKLCT